MANEGIARALQNMFKGGFSAYQESEKRKEGSLDAELQKLRIEQMQLKIKQDTLALKNKQLGEYLTDEWAKREAAMNNTELPTQDLSNKNQLLKATQSDYSKSPLSKMLESITVGSAGVSLKYKSKDTSKDALDRLDEISKYLKIEKQKLDITRTGQLIKKGAEDINVLFEDAKQDIKARKTGIGMLRKNITLVGIPFITKSVDAYIRNRYPSLSEHKKLKLKTMIIEELSKGKEDKKKQDTLGIF